MAANVSLNHFTYVMCVCCAHFVHSIFNIVNANAFDIEPHNQSVNHSLQTKCFNRFMSIFRLFDFQLMKLIVYFLLMQMECIRYQQIKKKKKSE